MTPPTWEHMRNVFKGTRIEVADSLDEARQQFTAVGKAGLCCGCIWHFQLPVGQAALLLS